MTALVEARDLCLAGFESARSFDITIAAGQRWLFTGGTGSGKSTLVRTLLGLMPAARGEVFVGGINLHDVSPKQLRTLRQGMGVVFSGGGLMPAWTGLDNLTLPLRASKGLRQADAETAVLEFAQRCELPLVWLYKSAAQLSAEQTTLLALARALIIQPQLLWVDSALVWGLLSHAGTRLGVQLAQQVTQGCALVVCAGASGVPTEQVPPCGPPTHWGQLDAGWLECNAPITNWTLEP